LLKVFFLYIGSEIKTSHSKFREMCSNSWRIIDQLDVTYYFISLPMCSTCFRALIYRSSGACDYSVELLHWSYCYWFDVSVLQAETCNTDTTPTQPHRISNTHRTKKNTTNVVIQQNSRKLLMMDI